MGNSAIIEFRNACVRADMDAVPCRNISLLAGPGDAILVSTTRRGAGTPFCDAAEGLLDPLEGEVRFLGQSWRNVPPTRAAALRARIGRVFCDPPWVSNLTVYDNLALSTRHHTCMKEAEIRTSIERLAMVCGVDAVPSGHASTVRSDVLQRLQWVRAFMGQPELALLEEPGEGLAGGELQRLTQVVTHARSEGTAVVWLTSSPDESGILSFTRRYALRDGIMSPFESD